MMEGNLIEVSDEFLGYLDEQGEIVVRGSLVCNVGGLQDDMIISTRERTYKLRGINLPTSLLIVNQKGVVDFGNFNN